MNSLLCVVRSYKVAPHLCDWLPRFFLPRLLIFCLTISQGIARSSPPSGPPWVHKLSDAQRFALEKSLPLLVCATKDEPRFYHEELESLFSDPILNETYGKLSWLWVEQTHGNYGKNNEDTRTWLRFGVTAYPQILLVNPTSLEILKVVGRTPNEFIFDVKNVNVTVDSVDEPLSRLREAEKRARALQSQATTAFAKKCFADEDIVVRMLALRVLAKKDPNLVLDNAKELVQTPHDPFRFEVCALLAKYGSSRDVTQELEFLFQKPDNSLNPNLLRTHVVSALGTCGTSESLQVLAPQAANGDYRNVLTGACVEAIGRIAKRLPSARAEAVKILLMAFPQPTEDRLCKQLAIQVHQSLVIITGLNVPMPESYNEQSRYLMIEGFKRYLPE